MDWFASVVLPILISAGVSLLLGPLRAKWEEAARRDLSVRREVARFLGALILSLRRELSNRKILRGGGSVPRNAFLSSSDFNTLLWPVVQRLDDPDLNRKVARKVLERLKYLAGWRIDYLRSCPEDPQRSTEWEKTREVHEAVARGAGQTETLVDQFFDSTKNYDMEIAEKLLGELEAVVAELQS